MKLVAFSTAIMMAVTGCASQILESYVGKDITEVAMDYGIPTGVMDLPDGRRAFMWNRTATMTTPATTNISAVQSGNWVTGSAYTFGGGTSVYQCTYTLIGQRNPQGSYTVVDFRKPQAMCE